MEIIKDNYDLWKQHEEDKERDLDKAPECEYCGRAIMDDYAFHIDGEWWHQECLENEYLVEVIDE